MWNSLKTPLNKIGAWTIKHHWIFLLLIIGLQWLTGQMLENPLKYDWLMGPTLARQIHLLNSKLIFALMVYMGLNKLWLYLKRTNKI